MGKANRAKREAKRKERHRAESPSHTPSPAQHARDLIDGALDRLRDGDRDGFDLHVALLAEQDNGIPGWTKTVDHTLTSMITSMLATLWRNGWQPADVVRLTARRGGRAHVAAVTDLIAVELRGYAPATVPERWTAQLDALDATIGRDGGYFSSRPEPRLLTLTGAVELLRILTTFPRLERLGPIPGQARRTTTHTTTVDDKTLTRVRALLAQAESTTFEAEAETFTAAAQRLMAKHSIDMAMLHARADGDRDRPAGIRLGVDAPYEQAKATLLAVVADANRCRAVWSRELGFSTVLGFDADLDAVDLLFTSLLVQATTAIVRAGTKRHGSGQSRTRSFRESFLQAFTARIGERLGEAAAATIRDEGAARGTDLVPLLSARKAEVDNAVEAMFPELVQARMRGGYDREGWAAGRAAADQAHLSVREQVNP